VLVKGTCHFVVEVEGRGGHGGTEKGKKGKREEGQKIPLFLTWVLVKGTATSWSRSKAAGGRGAAHRTDPGRLRTTHFVLDAELVLLLLHLPRKGVFYQEPPAENVSLEFKADRGPTPGERRKGRSNGCKPELSDMYVRSYSSIYSLVLQLKLILLRLTGAASQAYLRTRQSSR